MRRTKKLIIAILIVILVGMVAVLAGTLFLGGGQPSGELAHGDKNVLVCAIDEGEKRPGMGACDMAFIVHLQNGTVKNYTAVYPHGMTHPTKAEPAEAQAQGAGSKMLLHDSFWYNNTTESMENAKEIVEYNTHVKIDAVVAVNTEAMNAIMNSAGPLYVDGKKVNTSSISIVREEQYNAKNTRGNSVLMLTKALANATKDPSKKAAMVQTALDQYSKENIVMAPKGDFVGLLSTKGFGSLFG